MIVAHLSDLHLGFRAYGRSEQGVDVRERDVAVAFERAIQEVVTLAPGVIVVAGDVFDRPDPPAGAVVVLARALELLRSSLPETPVLMVSGPRDTPRRPGDPGALAVLDTFPNVEAATGLTRSILMEKLDLHVTLVPYRATLRDPPPAIEPDPRARWNLLVMHGRTGGAQGTGVFVDPHDWDYIALGGEHRRRQVSPGVEYSGALERVALDPWSEAADEKGFLVVDLSSGATRFHPIAGRAVAALAPIRVLSGDADRIRRRVAEVMREVPGGITGKIVRLRLDGIEPEELLALQGDPLGELRSRALHLAVEAGKELRPPPDAWPPADAPAVLRASLAEELERDGMPAGDMEAALEGILDVPWPPPERPPLGDLASVDGQVHGVGRVSTSLPEGLTAVIGGAGRSRRSVVDLLVENGSDGRVGDPLVALWAGHRAETLDGSINQALAALVEVRGLRVIDDVLRRLIGSNDDGPTGVARSGPPGSATTSSDRDVEALRADLEVAERELRSARADAAEVAGDLQVAIMDWHRERQDAETTLHAYRDRARELKGRLRQIESAGETAHCPTCDRPLAAHYADVVAELQDEWEAVVQDGSWWKQRWEQLELKPAHLRGLEGTSVRLHASVEAGAERVEILRVRLGDTAVQNAPPTEPLDERNMVLVQALRRVREARLVRARDVLLARASRFVGRISGGRILAVTWSDGCAHLHGDASDLTPASEDDLAAGRLAVRLAGASLVAGGGRVLASLVVEEPFDRLDEEVRVRVLRLMRKLLSAIPRIVLVCRGDAVDATPELFDAVLEIRDDPGSGPAALKAVLSGAGRICLKEVPNWPTREGRSAVHRA